MQDGTIFDICIISVITLGVSAVGLIAAIKPEWFTTLEIQTNKKKKVNLTVTSGATIVYRILGVVFFIMGLMMFLNAVQFGDSKLGIICSGG